MFKREKARERITGRKRGKETAVEGQEGRGGKR